MHAMLAKALLQGGGEEAAARAREHLRVAAVRHGMTQVRLSLSRQIVLITVGSDCPYPVLRTSGPGGFGGRPAGAGPRLLADRRAGAGRGLLPGGTYCARLGLAGVLWYGAEQAEDVFCGGTGHSASAESEGLAQVYAIAGGSVVRLLLVTHRAIASSGLRAWLQQCTPVITRCCAVPNRG